MGKGWAVPYHAGPVRVGKGVLKATFYDTQYYTLVVFFSRLPIHRGIYIWIYMYMFIDLFILILFSSVVFISYFFYFWIRDYFSFPNSITSLFIRLCFLHVHFAFLINFRLFNCIYSVCNQQLMITVPIICIFSM